MVRRYLTLGEAEGVLRRGKMVEAFMGACSRDGEPGIRRISIQAHAQQFVVSIFETADLGRQGNLDLYEFGPLNSELELDEPDERLSFESAAECWRFIEERFPGSSFRMVNQGMIQDEYGDFLKQSGRG